ncbi:MAG: Stk1 family PASTA domain-containing Ser/Thr kinase [Lachnospiraceae bacterium]|nr:Stk1 family PASTA domain-containing Ser/Thr kinase [Lachnospiraceae bacterium]
MIKIGVSIADRYEILEKIGTGGMSDVYKAKDRKLGRNVAVKILKQEFAENVNFVSKFRAEAQAAAGLMHPNIVNVYDVGNENGVSFIVMELVEGITLKKYIEKKSRLSVKEAVSIAIQVSMGIESAHNAHIIHRDIKPQNIIISKDGKVKVTDFGIAKAATSNTISSNVMGSVHYTSPEQARGGYSDERSDIYSLGITMYEMLTGKVPFNGDTTVAIAIKHIQEPMPSLSDNISNVPVSVERIVDKCCQKSPDRRYQNMGELIADLKQSLINPDDDFVKDVGTDEDAATRDLTEGDLEDIRRRSRDYDEDDGAYDRDYDGGYGGYRDGYNDRNYPPVNRDYDDDDRGYYGRAPRRNGRSGRDSRDDRDQKSERMKTIVAILSAIILGIVVLVIAANAFGFIGEKQEAQVMVEMPNVIGGNVDDVKEALLSINLTPVIKEYETSDKAEGTVLSASVEAGTLVEPGTEIELTVSKAKDQGIELPDVTGLTQAEARATLEELGFEVTVTTQTDAAVKENYVISQMPSAGIKNPAGSVITIYVSSGAGETETPTVAVASTTPPVVEAKVVVPDTIGLVETDAIIRLTEAGLTVGASTYEYSDTVAVGVVMKQSYNVGVEGEKKTVVSLTVSNGHEQEYYSYADQSIEAPSSDEGYTEGTDVNIVLTSDDGTQLLSTTVNEFPYKTGNITGISSSTGTLTLTFKVKEADVTTTDEAGNVNVIEGQTSEKTVSRSVTFTPQS